MFVSKPETPLFELTPHQTEKLQTLIALTSVHKIVTLSGAAGTGKTTTLSQLILDLKESKIAIAATTNQAASNAAKVIFSKTGREISAYTIHSLLGYQLREQGSEKVLVKKTQGSLAQYKFVIIDEASMLEKLILQALETEIVELENQAPIVILVGDACQLPPLGEMLSQSFNYPGVELTEVLRQKEDNPASQLIQKCREAVEQRHLNFNLVQFSHISHSFDGTQGVWWYSNRHEWLSQAIRASQKAVSQNDPYFAKVLAYRNQTVDSLNATIRQGLYPHCSDAFVAGELLVTKDFYDQYKLCGGNQTSTIPNSTPVTVHSAQPTTSSFLFCQDSYKQDAESGKVPVLHTDFLTFQSWELVIETPQAIQYKCTVLDPAEQSRLMMLLKFLVSRADWSLYYNIREQFAPLAYNYALTIHKAQGLTIANTFLHYHDLERRHYIRDRQQRYRQQVERLRMLYTATSRTSNRLIILV